MLSYRSESTLIHSYPMGVVYPNSLQDIVQASPSRFPISSQELFSILDDASERTFLCGAAVSMQKYIFDGEAGKIGLETKNLVACTCFLLEQKLVPFFLFFLGLIYLKFSCTRL